MPESNPVRASQLTPGQRLALSWFADHFEPEPDAHLFVQLVEMGLVLRDEQGTLCRTDEGERLYKELVRDGSVRPPQKR